MDAAASGLSSVPMIPVEIVLAPFHGGVRGNRVGRGPLRLLELGLVDRLAAAGADVTTRDLGEIGEEEGEVGRSFEVKRRVARAVAEAVRDGRFPVVLAGNCNAEVGTYAGLGSPDAELVWFDGHADFHTPDDLTSGYFDSMGAATLTGRCWQALAATVPGFRPLDPGRLVYCGSRNLAPAVRARMARHGIRIVPGGADRPPSFAAALNALLGGGASRLLIHLDVDCLDTAEGCANAYAEPGGLSGADLLSCLDRVLDRVRPLALTVASYDPGQPGADRIGEIAAAAVERVVRSPN